MVADLDYPSALKLAQSLRPKTDTPDSKAATKAEVQAAVQKIVSAKAKATSPPKQSQKPMKAKEETAKNPQSISPPKKAKADVLPDAAKTKKEAKKAPAKGRSESPAKK